MPWPSYKGFLTTVREINPLSPLKPRCGRVCVLVEVGSQQIAKISVWQIDWGTPIASAPAQCPLPVEANTKPGKTEITNAFLSQISTGMWEAYLLGLGLSEEGEVFGISAPTLHGLHHKNMRVWMDMGGTSVQHQWFTGNDDEFLWVVGFGTLFQYDPWVGWRRSGSDLHGRSGNCLLQCLLHLNSEIIAGRLLQSLGGTIGNKTSAKIEFTDDEEDEVEAAALLHLPDSTSLDSDPDTSHSKAHAVVARNEPKDVIRVKRRQVPVEAVSSTSLLRARSGVSASPSSTRGYSKSGSSSLSSVND
ncbi:hypothetical protein BKA70DRAFT_1241068 [Coprinopsis sp. MPI-PUGE-AT-0042]|nr:hypothetical protein BKA70DRAFT_1241068 [Coprinopsis sp. MPI-PUGE-AT-0042]